MTPLCTRLWLRENMYTILPIHTHIFCLPKYKSPILQMRCLLWNIYFIYSYIRSKNCAEYTVCIYNIHSNRKVWILIISSFEIYFPWFFLQFVLQINVNEMYFAIKCDWVHDLNLGILLQIICFFAANIHFKQMNK